MGSAAVLPQWHCRRALQMVKHRPNRLTSGQNSDQTATVWPVFALRVRVAPLQARRRSGPASQGAPAIAERRNPPSPSQSDSPQVENLKDRRAVPSPQHRGLKRWLCRHGLTSAQTAVKLPNPAGACHSTGGVLCAKARPGKRKASPAPTRGKLQGLRPETGLDESR